VCGRLGEKAEVSWYSSDTYVEKAIMVSLVPVADTFDRNHPAWDARRGIMDL
jgi:hypothetical protein